MARCLVPAVCTAPSAPFAQPRHSQQLNVLCNQIQTFSLFFVPFFFLFFVVCFIACLTSPFGGAQSKGNINSNTDTHKQTSENRKRKEEWRTYSTDKWIRKQIGRCWRHRRPVYNLPAMLHLTLSFSVMHAQSYAVCQSEFKTRLSLSTLAIGCAGIYLFAMRCNYWARISLLVLTLA